MMHRFSVIITVFNRPALVRQAIDSVWAQSFTDREIIVVDDASTDATPEVLKSYGDKIRVITHPSNQGCENAYISGAAAARGRYLSFLDSDDQLFPWALATYDFVLTHTGMPALLVSRLAFFSGAQPPVVANIPGDTVEVVRFADYLSRDRNVRTSLSMIVVRRDAFDRAGGFSSSTATTFNGSDQRLLLRLGCLGPAILLERPRTVAYRCHEGNSIRNTDRVLAGFMRLLVAERCGEFPGGWKRALDRRALIGKEIIWWGRKALLHGPRLKGARILVVGCDMVLARIVKKLLLAARGMAPTEVLRRDASPPAPRPDR